MNTLEDIRTLEEIEQFIKENKENKEKEFFVLHDFVIYVCRPKNMTELKILMQLEEMALNVMWFPKRNIRAVIEHIWKLVSRAEELDRFMKKLGFEAFSCYRIYRFFFKEMVLQIDFHYWNSDLFLMQAYIGRKDGDMKEKSSFEGGVMKIKNTVIGTITQVVRENETGGFYELNDFAREKIISFEELL